MKQFSRIDKILGQTKNKDWESQVLSYFEFLKQELSLPVEVTGIEDFRWEEVYIFNPHLSDEYTKKKISQPSYKDIFILQDITIGEPSKWMLQPNEDICANVLRKHDKKKFKLGLSELVSTDKTENSFQLLDDYSVFLCNYCG